jgi:hypothetical protein
MAAGFRAIPRCRRLQCRRNRRPGLPVAAAVRAAPVFLLLLLVGCASSAIPVEGDDTLVRCRVVGAKASAQGAAGGVEFMLINELHSDYDRLYAQNKDRASVKRVPQDMFLVLLERLRDEGFFDMAVPGDPVATESRMMITVETPTENWILAKEPTFTIDDHNSMMAMFEIIRSCHDSVWTFKVIDNESGGEFFIKEREKLQDQQPKRQTQ